MMDLMEINNEVILIRRLIYNVRRSVIQKLLRQIRKLSLFSRIGKEQQLKKTEKKISRLHEEIKIIKTFNPDIVFKLAVCNSECSEKPNEQIDEPNDMLKIKAYSLLAATPLLQQKVSDFKKKYPNWKSVAYKSWCKACKSSTKKAAKETKGNSSDEIPVVSVSVSGKENKNVEHKLQDDSNKKKTKLGKVAKGKRSKKVNNVHGKCYEDDKDHNDLDISGEQNEIGQDFTEKMQLKSRFKDNHDFERITPQMPKGKIDRLVNREMMIMKFNLSQFNDEEFIVNNNLQSEAETDLQEEEECSSFFVYPNRESECLAPKTAVLAEQKKEVPECQPLNRKQRRALMRGKKKEKYEKEHYQELGDDERKPDEVLYENVPQKISESIIKKPKSKKKEPPSEKSDKHLHPSWEAKRKLKEQTRAFLTFQGKKMKFEN